MSLSSEQRTTAETDALKELAYRSQHEPLPPCTGATRKLGRRAGEGPQLRPEGGDDPLGIGNQPGIRHHAEADLPA
jgi:hypothetical protein